MVNIAAAHLCNVKMHFWRIPGWVCMFERQNKKDVCLYISIYFGADLHPLLDVIWDLHGNFFKVFIIGYKITYTYIHNIYMHIVIILLVGPFSMENIHVMTKLRLNLNIKFECTVNVVKYGTNSKQNQIKDCGCNEIR